MSIASALGNAVTYTQHSEVNALVPIAVIVVVKYEVPLKFKLPLPAVEIVAPVAVVAAA
jgi:hypothetical protein